MRAKTINESITKADVLLKQKQKLQTQLIQAQEAEDKAYAKQAQFIQKYGEVAWDANIDNYSDRYGTNLSRYAQKHGRYPGFAIWNGEGPIMRKINNAVSKKWAIEKEIEELDKKIETAKQSSDNQKVKKYYGKWETADNKRKDNMMNRLYEEIHIYVNNSGYDYIQNKNHPGYGKYLKETSIEELAESYFEDYNEFFTREQIEEVVTHIWNIEYLGGYRDDNGSWKFPKK